MRTHRPKSPAIGVQVARVFRSHRRPWAFAMKRPAASGASLLKLPPLKYSNVSRRMRRGGRVIYMATHAKKYLGCFASEHAAALAAAKAKGVPLGKLRFVAQSSGSSGSTGSSARGSSASAAEPRKSQWRGVTFHVRTGRWVAQHGRGGFLGSFAEQRDAAAAYAEATGRLERKPKGAATDLEAQAARFVALLHVYQAEVPGDLETAVSERVRCPALAHLAPLLQQVSLRGKEGPWKAALRQVWLASPGSSGSAGPPLLALGSAVQAEAEPAARLAHAILADACRAMVGVDRDPWISNLGRSVSHHSGWLPLMASYGVLREASGRDRARLALGKMGKFYSVVPFSRDVHVPRFRHAHLVATLLNVEGAPRTLSEWGRSVARVRHAVLERGLSLPGALTGRKSSESTGSLESTESGGQGYHWPWYVRSHLLVEMRAAGIPRLVVDRDVGATQFAAMFPDQGRWVKAYSADGSSLQGIVARLQYKGPVELLTMHLCLCGDAAVTAQPPELLRTNVQLLRHLRVQYAAAHGLQPHPAVLMGLLSSHRPAQAAA